MLREILVRIRKSGHGRRETQQPAQSLEHGRIIVNNGNPGGSFRHEEIMASGWSPVELTVGPIEPVRYFEIWAFSAMRTRSATVRMPSFSIIRLR